VEEVIAASLDPFDRKFVGKPGDHHLVSISQGLQFAITAFFTGRAKMIARDEQNLNDGFAEFIEFGGVVLHHHAFGYWGGTGCHIATAHFDVTNSTRPSGFDALDMAQGGNINAIFLSGVNQRLTRLGIAGLPVDLKSYFLVIIHDFSVCSFA
jgi:hypothetical protein